MSHIVANMTGVAGCRSAWRLAAIVVALGLALGACSKCDVPTWQPNRQAPQSCHDGPAAQ